MVYEITDDNFQEEVIDSGKPCIIEFTAGWCTFCDSMASIFEELSKKFGDEVKFCLVNIDEQKKLRIRFAVACLPYIVMIHDGMRTPLFDEIVTADRLEERIRFMMDGNTAPNTKPL